MAVLMAITAADPIEMGIDSVLDVSVKSIGSESGGLAGLLTSKKEIGDEPPAYLNYLFFDREMNYKYGGFPESLRSWDGQYRCPTPPLRMVAMSPMKDWRRK
jgi:hypothetical protein